MNCELPRFHVLQTLPQTRLLGASNTRVKPFAHFHTSKFVSVSVKESFEHGEVKPI